MSKSLDARRLKIDDVVLATHNLLRQSRLARSSRQPCEIRLTTRFLAKFSPVPKLRGRRELIFYLLVDLQRKLLLASEKVDETNLNSEVNPCFLFAFFFFFSLSLS